MFSLFLLYKDNNTKRALLFDGFTGDQEIMKKLIPLF